MINIIQLILIGISTYAYSINEQKLPSEKLKQWSNLLHYSVEYHPTGNWFSGLKPDPFEELKYQIQNNSTEKCIFPLRNNFLFENKLISQNNLIECIELNNFIDQLNYKHVSIMLTSEFLNSPASTYGHISIVFHNNNYPELNSDVFHFSAIQHDEGLKSTISGLTGGLTGYFFRDKYHKKFFEYSIREQRKIHLWNLNLDYQEKKRLIYHLFELRNAQFRYYFLDKNCSYQIAKLIGVATNREIENKKIFLPSDTIKIFSDILNKPKTIFPKSEILKNYKEKKLENCYEREKNLINFFTHKKSTLNYKEINSTLFCNEENFLITEEQSNISYNHLNTRISISYNHTLKTKKQYTQVNIRPTAKDIYDFQNFRENLEFNLFTADITIKRNNIRLNNLKLIELTNLPPNSELNQSPWKFSISLNRENDKKESRTEIAFSKGFSKNIKRQKSSSTFNFFYGGSLDRNTQNNYKPNIVLSTQVIFEKLKYKLIQSSVLKRNNSETFFNSDIQLIKSLNKNSLFFKFEYSNEFTLSSGLNYYF